MHESADFLKSLQHNNSERPLFTIKPAEFDTMLEVQYRGQRMAVPISEVLHFAARWQADREQRLAQRDAQDPLPRLHVHPYPLYSVRLDDPDRAEWWVPFE